jgi:quercetin dioxygenase-like cupin family protein
MDRQAFEARLKEDGYTEIEAKFLQARPANDEHDHNCAVRGLVLAGTFIVKRGDVKTAYRAGEIFSVAAGEDHSEEIGPEGAEVVVGRKY